MLVEWIEWDEVNVLHATAHGVSVSEIEQAIRNARTAVWRKGGDRGVIRSVTDGGRPVVVIIDKKPGGGIRPAAAMPGKG